MAIDLRQVMAAFLTASMFVMFANMIKRDHIDPLLEHAGASPNVQYDMMKVSKQSLVERSGTTSGDGPWKQQNRAPKPCWKKPTPNGGVQSKGYIFFSLTNGPEYHASQVANAVSVARYLGATLVLPDIKGSKQGEKRPFGEVYDVNKFISSFEGVVEVVKNHPAEVPQGKITTLRVPNRVSENFIASRIQPLFRAGRNLRLITYFPSSAMVKAKKAQNASPFECLAMFQALDLQPELKQLADSMVGTLRSLSQKNHGQFVAVDLKVDGLGKMGCKENYTGSSKGCFSAEEIGQFLMKIGFQRETTIYLTQSEWDQSLSRLRETFPNTFTEDAIMPMNGKAQFMDPESSEVQDLLDFHICTESDVFVPAYSSLFHDNVAGKRIATGKTQILVPSHKTSASATDYISPYVSIKSHPAYSCFC